ncbi:hypothetical protein KIN20_012356 [Parelaphostrongylus tenuis]|uniref:Uncharacterized protein n=1 Tax=Parelaphostrongylus tenuis TaxID=148309 RepID=A0AAD5MT78_PARTN|nr:hypothetical protein KIN20_012356 [Parelaphostrongylus tenuis]
MDFRWITCQALEMNISKFPIDLLMILLLASIMTALGCGVIPAGQASSRPFTVSGFSLPVAMVYSTKAEVATSVPGIATSQAGARGFVQRLVMKTVFDVLELQGRSALLPDAVISAILGQLSVNITYEPLDCEEVAITLEEMVGTKPQPPQPARRCIIVGGNTVTGICSEKMPMADAKMCKDSAMVTKRVFPPITRQFRNCLDHEHHHGQLVEGDVAKCTE